MKKIKNIIGLPEDMFFGTSISTVVLVLKKCRKKSDKILFIDASKEFDDSETKNKLRDQDISKIISEFKDRKNIDKYSYSATLKEVEENDYNLNITRYVDTFEEEADVDLDEVSNKIKQIDLDLIANQSVVGGFCDELGISKPF